MFEHILLGIIQGLTEFLPVSSSAHLVIVQSLFKKFSQPGLLYDVMLHFGTFCAVILYFRKRIGKILQSFFGIFTPKYRITYYENSRFLWGIILASIPTAAIGLYLESYAETFFLITSISGYGLIFTSVLLYLSDRFKQKGEITGLKSFLSGIVQGIAVIPGISRSGSTITALIFMGVKREEAAEFSFLMSLPAIFGATLLQMRHLEVLDKNMILTYLFGTVTAFIFGLFAIHIMLMFVKKASLKIFALYCLILGIVTVIWL